MKLFNERKDDDDDIGVLADVLAVALEDSSDEEPEPELEPEAVAASKMAERHEQLSGGLAPASILSKTPAPGSLQCNVHSSVNSQWLRSLGPTRRSSAACRAL